MWMMRAGRKPIDIVLIISLTNRWSWRVYEDSLTWRLYALTDSRTEVLTEQMRNLIDRCRECWLLDWLCEDTVWLTDRLIDTIERVGAEWRGKVSDWVNKQKCDLLDGLTVVFIDLLMGGCTDWQTERANLRCNWPKPMVTDRLLHWCLSVSLSLFLSLSVSVSLCLCLSVSLCVFVSILQPWRVPCKLYTPVVAWVL